MRGLLHVEHGVNALEMITNLVAGIAAAKQDHPEQLAKFTAALANLTKPLPGPDYYSNLINLRIQVRFHYTNPCTIVTCQIGTHRPVVILTNAPFIGAVGRELQ